MTSRSALHLRRATEADVATMAAVHKAAYSRDHFLALLPEAELADYYRRFLDGGSEAVVAMAGDDPGGLAGFAVFGTAIEPRIAAFKRERRAAIARAALGHPTLALRRALGGIVARVGAAPAHRPAPWLLLSIAVAPGHRGVGRVLLEAMIARAAEEGVGRLGLYVRHANITAINAYLRVGFMIVESMADQYYMERIIGPLNS
ncbi:MAG: GNAT family N-acetyltransferase [Minisyncoccota bacterium]